MLQRLLSEIRIAGFGGQGVILAASVQVILSSDPILYPYVARPDILVVMSQEAYSRFSPQLKPGGILITEQDLVRIDEVPEGIRVYGVPATRLAEELGRKVVL